MLTAKKNWKFLPPPSSIAINQLQEELKTTKNPYFLPLMVSRGILTFDQAKHFMVPSLEDLPDPFLMQDMDRGRTLGFGFRKWRENTHLWRL